MTAHQRTLPFLAVIACALSASGAYGQQLLLNTGFESVTGNIPDDWSVTSAFSEPDGQFGAPANSGARMLQSATNFGYTEGTAVQSIPVAPGVYDLELSFFAWIRDDGGAPSSATGEIIVDGEVVAAASKTELGEGTFNASGLTPIVTTWKGQVNTDIAVRMTLIADGPGGTGWGIVTIDDVELWSRNCVTQHEITDVSPNVFDLPVANESITLTGTDLDAVTDVRMIRSPFDRQFGEIEEIASTTLTPNGDGTSLAVDLSSAGADPGFYDLIVEQSGCNARTIPSAIQVRDPAAQPNLLVNASFEVDDDAGNAVAWFGEYTKDQAPTPSPTAVSGYSAWANSVGEGGQTEEKVFWQEVPVTPGDTVQADGTLNCTAVGAGPSTCDITVNLWSMTSPSPTLIDTFSMDETTLPNRLDDWVDFSISGSATASSVAVETITTLFAADFGSPVSASADNYALTASPACDTQHRVWFANPRSGIHTLDPTLTIRGGTQLDQVTTASLVFVDDSADGDEPEILLPGVINTQGPTEMTVTFPVATNMAKEGLYNLVLEQPGCKNTNLEFGRVFRSLGGATPFFQVNVPPSFVDQFEVICANPTSLADVSPEITLSDDTSVDLTISGLEVDELGTVTLVHEEGTTIPGTGLFVVGNDLVATFDLSGAPCGFYDLEASRLDGCNAPAPLAQAFRLVKPGCNVLLNGDFEEEGPQGDNAAPVARWSTAAGHTSSLKYNGTFFVSSGGFNGTNNRGSTDESTAGSLNSTARVIQTQPAIPGVDATLTGAIYVGDLNTVSHEHRVLLRDGDEEGAIIDSFTLQQESPGATDWIPFSLSGRISQSSATVEWGHVPNPGGGSGGIATHVDEMSLIYTALPCNDPFADIDGDLDVDGTDFALLQLCITGGLPGHPAIPDLAYCACLDRDLDQDVDQSDFISFSNCVTGPEVSHFDQPNPLCSDQP